MRSEHVPQRLVSVEYLGVSSRGDLPRRPTSGTEGGGARAPLSPQDLVPQTPRTWSPGPPDPRHQGRSTQR
ncbi:hypothetical protein EYF80_068002 [Liparis tanakae]|uniref:Uncharacterized protein n=1 Tax=Liparis tanakae TaxID=230148 RepID=A0A4Z2DZL7_9TELE|nr:hypothetical protein EYF80_068002 [Liparis tanakae]